jgi:hypothetical protein
MKKKNFAAGYEQNQLTEFISTKGALEFDFSAAVNWLFCLLLCHFFVFVNWQFQL